MPLPVTEERVSASVEVIVKVDPEALTVDIPAPDKVSVPPKDTEPEPVLPAVENDEFASLALVTEELAISVVPTPPAAIETLPRETEKLDELKEAIPLARVVASSIVIVDPAAEALAKVKAPVKPFKEETPAPAPPEVRQVGQEILPDPST